MFKFPDPSLLLERQISSVESYQKSYLMMLEMWQGILQPLNFDPQNLAHISLNIQRISYGFISQSLLLNPAFKDWETLENDIILIVNHLIDTLFVGNE